MNSNLIVMLTYNDVTVKNALDLFEESKYLPVEFWGCKDIGLDSQQMKHLVRQMKAAGKTVFLEVVHYKEDECLQAAKLALECGVDYLIGTIFYDSIFDLVRDRAVKYFPFFGDIHGHPVVLGGEIYGIIRQGKEIQDKGVDGLDLLAYRYKDIEKVEELLQRCIEELNIPLISAGSINSWERFEQTKRSGIWAFTIGSAFFDKKFVPGGDFKEQIMAVYNRLASLPADEFHDLTSERDVG